MGQIILHSVNTVLSPKCWDKDGDNTMLWQGQELITCAGCVHIPPTGISGWVHIPPTGIAVCVHIPPAGIPWCVFISHPLSQLGEYMSHHWKCWLCAHPTRWHRRGGLILLAHSSAWGCAHSDSVWRPRVLGKSAGKRRVFLVSC